MKKNNFYLFPVCTLKTQTLINIYHQDHIVENIPTTVVYRFRTNCSDKVENDSIFKKTSVEYKACLLKLRYPEENINKKFIDFAIKKKRSKVLMNKDEKKRNQSINKYCFVMD